MYSERDDTRNPTTLATSSGLSMRPKGICLMRRRVNFSGDWLSSAACSRCRRPHVRLHKAGAHAVYADPIRSVRDREALGHADDRRLAGVVRQVGSAPDFAAIDAKLTMTPRFCAIMVGSTAWLANKTALALMFITAFQCSSATSSVSAAR
jgi:hypothetical protein